jgi:hypothetical protein
MNNNLGVVGVTPGTVQLYIVRVFGNDGLWAYSSDLIDAANRCASAGANIISMSLKSSSSSSTQQAKFDELNAQGILSIAAAGNDGDTSFSYPASYSSVISVAAIDSSKVVAGFSQRNNQVDIAAPGVGVRSTISGGYASWDGTSMATPHVSAVAALIWSAKPSATNEQVRTALINTAEDLGVVGRDDLYGYGLVNAKRAIDYLVTLSISPTSTPAPTTISQSKRVYTSGTQTTSYYPPGAANVITYMNCFTAVAAGETKLLLKEAIVGIIRIASAGALVDVGINIYATEMTSSYGRGTNHLVYSSPSLGSGTATSLQLVSTGDVTNQNIFLNLQLVSNPGWGGWWIGVELTGVNAASSSNGWRIVNAPTTGLSINQFGMYTSSSGFIFGYYFTDSTGGSSPSRFLVNVDGSLTSTTTSSKPTTSNPTTAKPTTAKPTTAKPTTSSPTTSSPTTAKPTLSPSVSPINSTSTASPSASPSLSPTASLSKSPMTSTPTASPSKAPTSSAPTLLPTTSAPTSLKPTSAKPTSSKPTTSKPSVKPSTQKPSSKPTTQKPSSKPTTQKPSSKPTTAKPSTKKPLSAKPTSSKPTTAKPSMKPTTKKPL